MARAAGTGRRNRGQVLVIFALSITVLFAAAGLAFDVGRFYSERRFIEGAIVYPFVTGTSRHGHAGSVVLAGPHAAEFSERFRQRLVGGPRFHA